MKYYGIKEAAKRTGLTAYTLRYYDKMGLLPFVERSQSGLRKFKEDDFEWLALINLLKDTGMKLEDIRDYIELCMDGKDAVPQRITMLRERKQAVIQQIKKLNQAIQKIDQQIDQQLLISENIPH